MMDTETAILAKSIADAVKLASKEFAKYAKDVFVSGPETIDTPHLQLEAAMQTLARCHFLTTKVLQFMMSQLRLPQDNVEMLNEKILEGVLLKIATDEKMPIQQLFDLYGIQFPIPMEMLPPHVRELLGSPVGRTLH